jgi:hypothetical protein
VRRQVDVRGREYHTDTKATALMSVSVLWRLLWLMRHGRERAKRGDLFCHRAIAPPGSDLASSLNGHRDDPFLCAFARCSGGTSLHEALVQHARTASVQSYELSARDACRVND